MTEPQFLTVGRIQRPHGVRGELLVEVLTDFPAALPGKTVQIVFEGHGPVSNEDSLASGPFGGAETPPERVEVVAARWHRGRLLMSLAGVDDRDTADGLRGALIQIDFSQAEPLAEGQYYHHQIVGLKAVTADGQVLGRVSEVLETGANDVYVVEKPEGGELLLPAIRSVVAKIDLPAGEMIVHLLEGLE